MTIEQLARSLNREPSEIAIVAREVLGLSGSLTLDGHYSLEESEAQTIRRALETRPSRDATSDDEAIAPNSLATDSVTLDRPTPIALRSFGALNYGVLVHEDVYTLLSEHESLGRRFGLVLTHLGAHGRTTVTKGCSDTENRGWLRSPLGGGSGNHYYLWWSRQGSRPVQDMALGQNDIVVRAVRHHDDHEPLRAGDVSDYRPFHQRDLVDDQPFVRPPWTADQLSFSGAHDAVRIVRGLPGSGKTTALWHTIESRSNQRVLYLTWSRDLTLEAEQHFRAFAPDGVTVVARDFVTFMSEICGRDVVRRSLDSSRIEFVDAAVRLGPVLLGPWHGRERGLFAEMRGYLLGRAEPGVDSTEGTGLIHRLTDQAYVSLRAGAIGKAAAKAVGRLYDTLQAKISFESLFPEFVAASEAIQKLRNDQIPQGLEHFDRLVIDEVQDLSAIESTVMLEACRAIARMSRVVPQLLIAGDEGQTVRPSGFDWGVFKDQLGRRFGIPKEFQLAANLRAPSRIADVIEGATRQYSLLSRHARPGNQTRERGGQHVEAELIHVVAGSRDDGIKLVAQVVEIDGVVVITPEDEVPRWLPDELREAVYTPASAKGREFQSVVVLDPGSLLRDLKEHDKTSRVDALDEHDQRTALDRFRVAISRATGTLVFIDVAADEGAVKASRSLLVGAVPFEPEELTRHLARPDTTSEERVEMRLLEARQLLDERPRRAWTLLVQAMRMLGDPALPNGVADLMTRTKTLEAVLTAAARLVVENHLSASETAPIVETVLTELRRHAEFEAFQRLLEWSADRDAAPFDLFKICLTHDTTYAWMRPALSAVVFQLESAIERSAADSSLAVNFADDVEGWLRLTGFSGDAQRHALYLRELAVDTLTDDHSLSAAEKVLAKIEPRDWLRTAYLREVQGRHAEAAEAFEMNGNVEDALYNWRKAARWHDALRCAIVCNDAELADLEWLVLLDSLIGSRPLDQNSRLRAQERTALKRLIEKIDTQFINPVAPPRRRR